MARDGLQDILGLKSCSSLTNVDLSHNLLSLHYEDESRNDRQQRTGCFSLPATGTSATHPDSGANVEAASNKGYEEMTSYGPADHSTGKNAEPVTSDRTAKTQTSEAAPSRSQQLWTLEASAGTGYLKCFKALRNLSTLYLTGNPVTKQITQYRRTLLAGIKRYCKTPRYTVQR